MHKEINIAMAKWENHFNKLQHGLTFDENNPDVIDISENKSCNEKLMQNDAGSSQNKSHNKHKKHSLDENVKNMVEKLRTIPRHLNIDKKKTLDVQFDSQKFPHETINMAGKSKTKPQTKCQSFCLCSYENIWDSEKKTSPN